MTAILGRRHVGIQPIQSSCVQCDQGWHAATRCTSSADQPKEQSVGSWLFCHGNGSDSTRRHPEGSANPIGTEVPVPPEDNGKYQHVTADVCLQ